MGTRVLQLQKRSSYEYKFIQDKVSISSDNYFYALADGTTQSFHSEKWAEIITAEFVRTPAFEPANIITLFRDCSNTFNNHEFIFSVNPAKAALEKKKREQGATATFIGLALNGSNLNFINVGDSNIFHIHGEVIDTYPFKTSDELDSNTYFLNTEKLLAEEVEEYYFTKGNIQLQNDSVILVCSDALSRLLLTKPECISEVIKINDFDALLSFCLKHWDNKEMQEDDISCVIIDNTSKKATKYIIPPKEFSFPKEEEYEFVPTVLENKISTEINNEDMENISSMINRLYGQLNDITNKSKLLFAIVISILVFSAGNFVMTITKSSGNPSGTDQKIIELQDLIRERELLIEQQQNEIDKLKTSINIKSTKENIEPDPEEYSEDTLTKSEKGNKSSTKISQTKDSTKKPKAAIKKP